MGGSQRFYGMFVSPKEIVENCFNEPERGRRDPPCVFGLVDDPDGGYYL